RRVPLPPGAGRRVCRRALVDGRGPSTGCARRRAARRARGRRRGPGPAAHHAPALESTPMETAVIGEGARTPIGKFLGALAEAPVAGGMENMSRTPFLLDRRRLGSRMGDAPVHDGMYRDGFLDPLSGMVMGETAENLARRYGIPREEQDEFALRSQQKAEEGKARRALEIVPVEVPGRKGQITTVGEDE